MDARSILGFILSDRNIILTLFKQKYDQILFNLLSITEISLQPMRFECAV